MFLKSDATRGRPLLCLSRQLADRIVADARRELPHEACGLLVGRRTDGGGEVVRSAKARNVSARPMDRFRLAPGDFLTVERRARGEGLEVLGFWHSHPAADASPSDLDRERGWEGYSYLIISLMSEQAQLRSWRRIAEEWLEETVRLDAAEGGSA